MKKEVKPEYDTIICDQFYARVMGLSPNTFKPAAK